MASVRVFQLARELGLKSADVIEKLAEIGAEVKTASSSVDEDTADKLKRTLRIDALTSGKKRIYGSAEDETEREQRAAAQAAKVAAERAEREKAAELARQAAEARKASKKKRPSRAKAKDKAEEGADEATALDHPPGAPRLAPRLAPSAPVPEAEAGADDEAATEAADEAGTQEAAGVAAAVVEPSGDAPAAAAAVDQAAPETVAGENEAEAPAKKTRTIKRVAGPVRPIAPPPAPAPPQPAPPPPAPAPARAAGTGPGTVPPPRSIRPLRPIPRPTGPHPTARHPGGGLPRSPHPVGPAGRGPRFRPGAPPPGRPPGAVPPRPPRPGARRRKGRDLPPPPVREEKRPTWTGPLRKITLSEGVTVKELGEKMDDVKSRDIIKTLIGRGVMATLNQSIEPDLAIEICKEFGYEATIQSFEEELTQEQVPESDPANLKPRAPVVTVMGHVDHGKTSLLDAIRETSVAAGEAGGITQHIGAYHVDVGERQVVFLDTPGHEAFTLMRARGAGVTDVVVLVVAADDGVMPQTLEAIDHSRAADVPIVVAVNKIDKPGAQPDRVKQQLSDRGLMPEEWGGSTVFVEVSAKQRQNLDQLLEMLLLVADLQELKADPDRPASGTVLEARLDKGRGPVATVLVQDGTLSVGDTVVAGAVAGKVRALVDDQGTRQKQAGPATPVEVLGLGALPEPGDQFLAVTDATKAQQIVSFRQLKAREQAMRTSTRIHLEDLGRAIAAGSIKELPLVIKADVQGSVEAVQDQLLKIPQEKIKLRVIRSGAGAISEGDVLLAAASDAVVIGFNVRPERKAADIAERDNVELRLYTVIYDAVEDMRKALEGMLEPTVKEVRLGAAEVRDTFKISKVGTIAGCFVVDGRVTRAAQVRLLRDNVVVHTGKVSSLKRFKDDVAEVKNGMECGIGIAGYNDVKPGDVIEFFTTELVREKLQ